MGASKIEKTADRKSRPKSTAERDLIVRLTKGLADGRAAHDWTRGKWVAPDTAVDTLDYAENRIMPIQVK